MIDYTWGHDGVGHEPLSFHIVDDGENPLRFNRGAVTGTATTASLNAISGSGHVTWAVDSVDSDQDEEFVTLTANLAVTGGGDVLHRMGYQVTILSTERRIT